MRALMLPSYSTVSAIQSVCQPRTSDALNSLHSLTRLDLQAWERSETDSVWLPPAVTDLELGSRSLLRTLPSLPTIRAPNLQVLCLRTVPPSMCARVCQMIADSAAKLTDLSFSVSTPAQFDEREAPDLSKLKRSLSDCSSFLQLRKLSITAHAPANGLISAIASHPRPLQEVRLSLWSVCTHELRGAVRRLDASTVTVVCQREHKIEDSAQTPKKPLKALRRATFADSS